jgi:2'-5' RNA ligase
MHEGAVQERLAGWIERLAVRYGTEPFAPHLTLLSGLEGPVAQVLATAAPAAEELTAIPVRAGGVAGREEHFRCLFAQAVPSPALCAAHEITARAFGRPPDPDFFPHLSLVYGSLPPGEKEALALELGSAASFRFVARRLHVWCTDGPAPAWSALGSFALGRVAPG